MKFGHAVGARSLEADHHHHVAVERPCLERRQHLVLVVEHHRRGLGCPALALDRAELEDRAAKIALDQLHAAVGKERVGGVAEQAEVL